LSDLKENLLISKKADKLDIVALQKGENFSSSLFDKEVNPPQNLFQKAIQKFANQVNVSIEERRLFIAIPFVMLFGIILYKTPQHEPTTFAIILLGVVLIAVLTFSFLRSEDIRLKFLLLPLFIGFSLLPIHGAIFGTKMLDRSVYGQYQARVEKILSNRDDGQRVIISNIIALQKWREVEIEKARLFIRKGEILTSGDIISGSIRFTPVPSPIVVGGYDGQFQSYFDSIGAYASTTKPPKIIGQAKRNPIRLFIDETRIEIAKRIDKILPMQSGSIAKALTVGDQSSIAPEIRNIMAASGLAHVLAISGLHLSLVAGGVFAFSRLLLGSSYRFAQKYNVKKISALIGIITALFYLALSGASVSAIRATVMLVLIFGAVLVGRRALTMRNVAFAAIFVIISDPASVFRPSFQLSFAAVIALVGIYEMMQHKSDKQKTGFRKFINFFGGLASTSLIAGLATALFAAYHFQQTAPLGVLGNLVALPIVAFIVLPFAFIGVIVMPFGFEAVFFRVMGFAIEKIIEIATIVTNWSVALNYSPLLLPSSLVIGLFAFAWLAFFKTRFRLIGILIATLLIATIAIDKRPDILIANSTKAIAVRGEVANIEQEKNDKKYSLALISGRGGSFAVNAWQETYQEEIGKNLEGQKCDDLACYFKSPQGYSLSLVKSKQAFYEDCYVADLIITRLYAPDFCRALTNVIDQSDLKKGGMHWVKWEKGNFIIRRAVTDETRPWRP